MSSFLDFSIHVIDTIDSIDLINLRYVIVVGDLMLDIETNQEASGYTDTQSDYVNDCRALIFEQEVLKMSLNSSTLSRRNSIFTMRLIMYFYHEIKIKSHAQFFRT